MVMSLALTLPPQVVQGLFDPIKVNVPLTMSAKKIRKFPISAKPSAGVLHKNSRNMLDLIGYVFLRSTPKELSVGEWTSQFGRIDGELTPSLACLGHSSHSFCGMCPWAFSSIFRCRSFFKMQSAHRSTPQQTVLESHS